MHKFIDNIVAFSLKNKFFIFFCTTIAVIAGVVSFKHTPIDAFPDVTNTKVTIITQWPGRKRRRGGEVHHHPHRDSHESGAEENGYPLYHPLRAIGDQCDV